MIEESNNLKHIRIEGFKSIQELDLPMGNINILIGANGSGKSNFISLFTFLNYLSMGKLKHYVATEGGADHFFHFGAKNTRRITFDLDVGINGYHVEFQANLDDDSLVFDNEFCTINTSSQKWFMRPRNGESGFIQQGEHEEDKVEEYTVQGYTKEYLDKCRVYHFHDTSGHARLKKTNPLSNYHYLETDAGNLGPFLYHLKKSKTRTFRESYGRIVSAIKTVAPFFHDFYLEPDGEEENKNILLRWIHARHDTPFSANILSDGTIRFICLATLFFQPASKKPATIVLDEPELGLHPAALEVLADIIKSTARKTQVICSTQSVVFANLFAPEDFIVVDAKEGVSDFRKLEKEPLDQWLEEYGVGDIWAKNLIGGRPAW